MSPVAAALNDLLWGSLPMRNLLKGEARTKFLGIWNASSIALCRGVFNEAEEPLQNPRDEAIRLHRRCLDLCAALGVKSHELVPHYTARTEGGFFAQGDAADHVVLLALHATRVARALNPAIDPRETQKSETSQKTEGYHVGAA